MAENRKVENDEIVDSILDVTVQCGLAVENIQIDNTTVNIRIKDTKRIVTFQKFEVPDMTLKDLKKAVEDQLHE